MYRGIKNFKGSWLVVVTPHKSVEEPELDDPVALDPLVLLEPCPVVDVDERVGACVEGACVAGACVAGACVAGR